MEEKQDSLQSEQRDAPSTHSADLEDQLHRAMARFEAGPQAQHRDGVEEGDRTHSVGPPQRSGFAVLSEPPRLPPTAPNSDRLPKHSEAVEERDGALRAATASAERVGSAPIAGIWRARTVRTVRNGNVCALCESTFSRESHRGFIAEKEHEAEAEKEKKCDADYDRHRHRHRHRRHCAL